MSAPPRDPSPPIHTAPTEKTGSIHRRSQSAAVTQTIRPVLTTVSIPSDAKQEHKRSFSMPMRRSTCQEPDGNEHSASAIVESTLSSRQLPVLDTLDASNGRPTSGGWWDVVSAVESDKPAPWHENPRSTHWKRTSSISASERFALPPGAEPARLPDSQSTYAEISKLVDLPSPRPLPLRSSPGGARAMNVSPGRNSPGQAADDPPFRTPGRVKTRVDDARPPPPFFPLNISRPSFPAAPADALSIGIISARTVTPASAGAPHPTKFKLGGFGRSMSFAINRKKEEREKDKENEKESPLGGKKVMNSPGKWNRDMVANIMGPPSERK